MLNTIHNNILSYFQMFLLAIVTTIRSGRSTNYPTGRYYFILSIQFQYCMFSRSFQKVLYSVVFFVTIIKGIITVLPYS